MTFNQFTWILWYSYLLCLFPPTQPPPDLFSHNLSFIYLNGQHIYLRVWIQVEIGFSHMPSYYHSCTRKQETKKHKKQYIALIKTSSSNDLRLCFQSTFQLSTYNDLQPSIVFVFLLRSIIWNSSPFTLKTTVHLLVCKWVEVEWQGWW